jgi:hypothetical protein
MMDGDGCAECEKALEAYAAKPDWPSFRYLSAICPTKLRRRNQAQGAYGLALQGCLERPQEWWRPGLPNFLVDCYFMANAPEASSEVAPHLEVYKSDRRSRALHPLYSFAALLVEQGRGGDALPYTVASYRSVPQRRIDVLVPDDRLHRMDGQPRVQQKHCA